MSAYASGPATETRPAGAADLGLVFSSWLSSFAHSVEVATPLYMVGHHALVERLLERRGAIVLTPAGDKHTVLGWICAGPSLLHYVYVKGSLRRAGLGRALCRAAGLFDSSPVHYTHRTHLGDRLIHILPTALYNPYALFEEVRTPGVRDSYAQMANAEETHGQAIDANHR